MKYSIGLAEIAGALTGENLDSLEFRCIETIMDYKLNAHGLHYPRSQFLLVLAHCNKKYSVGDSIEYIYHIIIKM